MYWLFSLAWSESQLKKKEKEPASNLTYRSHGEDKDHEGMLDGDTKHPPNEGLEWECLEIDRSDHD